MDHNRISGSRHSTWSQGSNQTTESSALSQASSSTRRSTLGALLGLSSRQASSTSAQSDLRSQITELSSGTSSARESFASQRSQGSRYHRSDLSRSHYTDEEAAAARTNFALTRLEMATNPPDYRSSHVSETTRSRYQELREDAGVLHQYTAPSAVMNTPNTARDELISNLSSFNSSFQDLSIKIDREVDQGEFPHAYQASRFSNPR